MDVGPAMWAFGSSKFSWSSGSSNVTLDLPTLGILAGSSNCDPTLSASLSKNSTAYIWTLTAASAVLCGGASITPVVKFYVENVTGAYNEKEVFYTITTTKAIANAVSVTNHINFGLVSPTAPSQCDSGTACTRQCFVSVCLDWSAISGSSTYNNSTETVTSTCVATAATTQTCSFDPLALDGSNSAHGSGITSLTISLSTSHSPDVIYVCASSYNNPASGISASGLSFTARITEGSGWRFEQCWYAIASGTLSSESIKVSWGSSDYGAVVGFGISGANTGSPFDSHSGIPAFSTTNNAATYSISMTTSNANDFLIFYGNIAQGSATVPPTSFTSIANPNSGGGTASLSYEIVSSSGSQTASNSGSGLYMDMNFDAIVQASSGVAYTATVSVTVSGTPSVQNNVVHDITATVSVSPTIKNEIVHAIAATVSIAPSVAKDVVHDVAGAVSILPSVTHDIIHPLSTTVSIAAGVGCIYNLNTCIAPVVAQAIQTNPWEAFAMFVVLTGIALIALLALRRRA